MQRQYDLEQIAKGRPFQGRFIVLDGPDYCGKGTQCRKLASYLMDCPRDRDNKLITVVATREPFNTKYQVEIRKILKESMDPMAKAEVLAGLFTDKDRRDHAVLIEIAKAFGCIVLSDRYKYSTLAYQSAQGVDLDKLIKMQDGMPVPDLTVLFCVALEERMRRKAEDRQRPFREVFDKAGEEFQRKLQAQFDLLPQKLPDENIAVIDGKGSRDDVFKKVREEVDKIIFK